MMHINLSRSLIQDGILDEYVAIKWKHCLLFIKEPTRCKDISSTDIEYPTSYPEFIRVKKFYPFSPFL